jgi:hypothetical protein
MVGAITQGFYGPMDVKQTASGFSNGSRKVVGMDLGSVCV